MYYFFILAYFFFQIRVWYCICACLNIFKHWTWFKQIWKTILKIVDDFICNIYVRKMWLPVKISYKICFHCKAKNQIFVILSLLQNQPKNAMTEQNCWLIRSEAKAVINAFVCQTSLSRWIRCIIMKSQYDCKTFIYTATEHETGYMIKRWQNL